MKPDGPDSTHVINGAWKRHGTVPYLELKVVHVDGELTEPPLLSGAHIDCQFNLLTGELK